MRREWLHLAAVLCIIHVCLPMAAPRADGADDVPSDYAREKKWADEITPGIVVGDPMYLQGRAGHPFLTLYTEASSPRAGLVIVHGNGVHPDWGLIGTLRTELATSSLTSRRSS